jgi:cell division transport system permease protein
VRKLTIFAACLLTAAALTAGCGLFGGKGESKEQEIERLIDQTASFTVFLNPDATAGQRTDIEARLRAIPGVTEVVYESKNEAYRRFRALWSSAPSAPDFFDDVRPDALPDSFQAKMTDAETLRKLRDSPMRQTLESLPGVEDVTFRCTTIDECRKDYSPQPTATPS